MAIFHDFDPTRRDRSAEDRRRHRELIQDSIKRNLGSIVAEESIIGQSKDKIFKIPVRGLKEYQFVFGENRPGVATGQGNEKRGQRMGQQRGAGGTGAQEGPGNIEGEDVYDTEITLEQLTEYLFEDIDLPFLERRKFTLVESEQSHRRWGIQRKGIPPRLSKKRSMMERIKRRQSTHRVKQELDQDEDIERFPFREEDLRYQRVKEDPRWQSNAVVICIMDNSGSMYQNKKFLARTFFFLLYQFIRYRYLQVELVFINHTTTAKEVNEDDFFHRGESGGTMISSGYEKALEIIEQRYSPQRWNIYTVHCSDGDNWPEDVEQAVQKAQELCAVCNLFGYCEITSSWTPMQTMKDALQESLSTANSVLVTINNKDDVWPAFRSLMMIADKE
ncbi:MAG: YeaH/YhbH family protein [Syntrophomonadaceae bacterium]|jgi:sporulation protein YhbH|nr:YeaH/YhbH family protein [Bacillota bacterium]NLP24771.1 YeaH/YhbH family protein [Syntrophomonadaceae bacterium]